jgi:hypothetical protein
MVYCLIFGFEKEVMTHKKVELFITS